MGLARVVLPAALLLAAFPVPASQAASAKCPSSTGRFAVWGAGVIANRKTPTARLMEERWLPNGRVEGLIVERVDALHDQSFDAPIRDCLLYTSDAADE